MTALEITDVRPTARPEIIEVVLAATGKPMRLRRDMVEFWPRRVVMPMWLASKLNLISNDSAAQHLPAPLHGMVTKQGL